MANRLKEDEKNERIIRSLLKLPDNRRCINCNSLGPQYVCTNFSTFVCTTCSGIHREFTHRVKSISMAKFTSQEVSALQGGGNASAKEIYLKEWDTQRHSFPDSSNVERLRDFIKHVYVDRRYTGERSFDKPPRVKGEIEDEGRRSDPYQGGSRSPPYEDTYDRRYSDKRSPGYEQRSHPYGDYGRSPAHTEILNDWRRDDRFGNGRRSDESRISDGGSSRSPDHQKDQDMLSPPMVRPVREILGESVSPLRVIEPPKAIDGRPVDVSVHAQRTASSSSLASSNGNPAELKVESSLIDFDAVPDPTVNAAVPKEQQSFVPQKQQTTLSQTQQPTTILSNVQPTSSNVDNWANFDPVEEVKVSQAPSNASSLESLFSDFSVPAPVPGCMAGVSGNVGAPITAPLGNMSALPSDNSPLAPVRSSFGIGATGATSDNSLPLPPAGVPPASFGPTVMLTNSGGNSFANAANLGQWTSMQHPYSLFPAGGVQPSPQILTPPSVQASSNQAPSGAAPAQATQATLKPTIEASSGVGTQPSSGEVRPSGRKELPVDLFTSNYQSFHAPVPGWQTGPFHGIGLPMQYNIAVTMPAFSQQSKSTNPFDAVSEPSLVQTQKFPSMGSLQGALPNMGGPAGLLRTSSLVTPSSSWMPPHAPTYASEMPPSSYMGQKTPSNIPVRQQGMAGFPLEGPSFGTLNSNQQPSGLYSAPPANTSSVGGNPFY